VATRALQVLITGDSSGFKRSLGSVDDQVDRSEKKMKRFGAVASTAMKGIGLAAAAVGAVGLKQAATAAIEAEKSQARLNAQLKASGTTFKAHADEIERVIQKHSRLSGLDDEDLQDSFTNIVRVTGDVNKSLKLTGLAADFARAKHMDVAKAGEIVAKVAGGNTGILGRYGIKIREGASATEALGQLQGKFAGQAEAYGKTTQGSVDRASVAWENLLEVLGAKLAPVIQKAADLLTGLFDRTSKGNKIIRAVGEAYVTYLGWIRDAVQNAIRWVKRFADRNREDIAEVVRAVRNLGRFFKNVFEDVILPVIKRLLPVLRGVAEGVVSILRGLIRIVTGIINGDWKRVWEGFKDIAKGAVRALRAILGGLWRAFRDAIKELVPLSLNAAKAVGKAIVRGIIAGIKAAPNAVADAIGSIIPGGGGGGPPVGRFGKIGDGIGKSLVPSLPSGAFGGNLDGAKPIMAPFAQLGRKFGLGVSDGLRPGGITSSGNTSWHASGNALDISGPAPGMLKYFQYLRRNFGSRLRELIYTPGRIGIKDGQLTPIPGPIYDGAVAQDHYDHVHVAYTGGAMGDGTGREPRTGDGTGVVGSFRRAIKTTNAPYKAALALFEAGIVESGLRNLNYGDSDSKGALQLRVSLHGERLAMDPYRSALAFLTRGFTGRGGAIALSKSSMSAGQVAAAVQGPAAQYRGRYDQVRERAARYLVQAATRRGGVAGGGGAAPSLSGGGGPQVVNAGGSKQPVDAISGQAGMPTAGLGYAGGVAAAQRTQAIGTARNNTATIVTGLVAELRLKRRRLKLIRAVLRTRIRPARRKRLAAEEVQLIEEIGTLSATLKEYRSEARGDAAAASGAESDAEQIAANLAADQEAAANLPTAADFIQARIDEASLTPDTADDKAALGELVGLRTQELGAARASGDPRRISEAIAAWKAATEALNGVDDSAQRLAEAMKSLADETKRQNDIYQSVIGVSSREAVKAMADMISGQIVGVGLQGRRQTAGTGATVLIP
jgi:hypothetical protein